jgi:hypothetical protein
MSKRAERAKILGLANSSFAELTRDGFNLHGYKEAYKDNVVVVTSAIETAKKAMKEAIDSGRMEGSYLSSPLFRFVVGEDLEELKPGENQWVGLIPETPSQKVPEEIINAADIIAKMKAEELEISAEELPKIRNLFRNALIASTHINLVAAKTTGVIDTNFRLEGQNERPAVSFQEIMDIAPDLYETYKDIRGNKEKAGDDAIFHMLTELGIYDEIPEAIKDKVKRQLAEAQREACKVYEEIGRHIRKGQKRAGIKGKRVKIDLLNEHKDAPLIELIGRALGGTEKENIAPKEQYEAQVISWLTIIMFQLLRNPAIRTAQRHEREARRRFNEAMFCDEKTAPFSSEAEIVRVYYDAKGKPLPLGETSEDWDEEYTRKSVIGSFNDLADDEKRIIRGNIRFKTSFSLLLKMMKDKLPIEKVYDLLAGEAILYGIREADLDSRKTDPQLVRRRISMIEEMAHYTGRSMGLAQASPGTHQRDLKAGQYVVKIKIDGDKIDNEHSFGFPTVKIYMAVPVGTPDSGEFIRFEYRYIPYDAWHRGSEETDSMSHHDNYKLRQAMELSELLIRRSDPSGVHQRVMEIRKWMNEAEREEAEARNLVA